MNNSKEVKPINKSGNVEGADCLTKKQRRALKVQEKQKDSPGTKIGPTPKPIVTPSPASKVDTKTSKTVEHSQKELRRVEWEKKLAEQKPSDSSNKDEQNLSKAELKQKRREQQEAQRLAKISHDIQKPKPQDVKRKPEDTIYKPTSVSPAKISPKQINAAKKVLHAQSTKLQLVSHLYATKSSNKADYEKTIVNYKNVHPVFLKLGVQYATKKILGSNARCLALLVGVKRLIEDLQTPPKHEFCRYFETVLDACVKYLQYCRPFAVSMTNAMKSFKVHLRKVTALPDDQKKPSLIEHIETYITDEIEKAGEAISLKVNEKICDEDVILTFSCSSLIKKILLDAHKSGKMFEVIVTDARPFLEGRQMLQRLVQAGIRCTYVQISAVSYLMSRVTKVLLGAHALLTNGYVMSRIGTAQVALVAQAYNKPVLVCCETYKFSEKVQTDSFVYNELGTSSTLTHVDTLEDNIASTTASKNDSNLTILNLLYDVTPPDLVTAVVTELAILPCTSVPVVLRIKPTDF